MVGAVLPVHTGIQGNGNKEMDSASIMIIVADDDNRGCKIRARAASSLEPILKI